MISSTMMNVDSWPYLFLLLLIPLFHRFWMRRNRSARVQYPLPIPKALVAMNPQRWLLGFRYLALGLLVVALARPQQVSKQIQRNVEGIDIVMVMDVSA